MEVLSGRKVEAAYRLFDSLANAADGVEPMGELEGLEGLPSTTEELLGGESPTNEEYNRWVQERDRYGLSQAVIMHLHLYFAAQIWRPALFLRQRRSKFGFIGTCYVGFFWYPYPRPHPYFHLLPPMFATPPLSRPQYRASLVLLSLFSLP